MARESVEMEQQFIKCDLCPRSCKVNRVSGQHGVCGVGAEPKVARAALHHWEETSISGKNGSGAGFGAAEPPSPRETGTFPGVSTGVMTISLITFRDNSAVPKTNSKFNERGSECQKGSSPKRHIYISRKRG